MTELAYLSNEGIRLFGDIFSNGVPIRSILRSNATLGDYKGIVYMADYNEFNDEQKNAIRQFMVAQRQIPENEIDTLLKQFKNCIPLRKHLVDSVMTDEAYKYL